LEDSFEKNKTAGQVEDPVGPRGQPLGEGGKEVLPGRVSECIINQWDAKVFGRKGASVET
jgi:hypothetical protein